MASARETNGQLDLLLLAVISTGEQHGYAIIRSLQDRSDGRFAMKQGTIYPALHRLESNGLVVSRLEAVDGRERRLYRLTARGHADLAERRAQWDRFASGVAAVLEFTP